MNSELRLTSHPVLAIDPACRETVRIEVDGETIMARPGETLAAALWANGINSFRRDDQTGENRGLYCGIGHCYECRVTLDGVEDVRSCLVLVREGMKVSLAGSSRKKGEERAV